MAITLTNNAAAALRKMLKDQDIEEESFFLRVGCKGGGCSGYTYSLDVVDSKADSDHAFTSHGVEVICDPKSFLTFCCDPLFLFFHGHLSLYMCYRE